MKHLMTKTLKGLLALTLILFVSTAYSQTKYTGYAYVLNSDDYVTIKYTRAYSGSSDEFVTKYTIYHPTKGYAWITVTATHNRADKTVKISVDDTNEGIFSHINDEETTYETPSLEVFGFRGSVGALAGKRVPNQLMVKFVSNKFENVKVVHVLGSEKSDFNNTMYFVLDEKN